MDCPRRREGSQLGPRRRLALWAALGVVGLLPTVGCQVEYAGMTLPSGKYMHDDVQYFTEGPEFPWANSVAETQRAYMRSQGLDVPGADNMAPIGPAVGAGALQPSQNVPNMPTNVNVMSRPATQPVPAPPPVGLDGNVPVPPDPAPGVFP